MVGTVLGQTSYIDGWDIRNSCFYANGRYWVFYVNAPTGEYFGNWGYKTSVDGETWGDFVEITASPVYNNYSQSTHYDEASGKICIAKVTGSMLDYVKGPSIEYRQGTMEIDGSITWDADWTVVATFSRLSSGWIPPDFPDGHTNFLFRLFSVVKDTDGYIWISFTTCSYYMYAGNEHSYNPVIGHVIKSLNTTGTLWDTQVDVYSNNKTDRDANGYYFGIRALNNNGLVAVATMNSDGQQINNIFASFYDGSWGSFIQINEPTITGVFDGELYHYEDIDMETDGQNIYIAYAEYAMDGDWNDYFKLRLITYENSTWSDTVIDPDIYEESYDIFTPTISLTSVIVRISYTHDGVLYYRDWQNGAIGDAVTVESDPNMGAPNSNPVSYDGTWILCWIEGASKPFDVVFYNGELPTPEEPDVTICGVALDIIIDFHCIEKSDVSVSGWINNAVELQDNIYNKEKLRVSYTIRTTSTQKYSLEQCLTTANSVSLLDEIYGIDNEEYFITRIGAKWEGNINWEYPWLIEIELQKV